MRLTHRLDDNMMYILNSVNLRNTLATVCAGIAFIDTFPSSPHDAFSISNYALLRKDQTNTSTTFATDPVYSHLLLGCKRPRFKLFDFKLLRFNLLAFQPSCVQAPSLQGFSSYRTARFTFFQATVHLYNFKLKQFATEPVLIYLIDFICTSLDKNIIDRKSVV